MGVVQVIYPIVIQHSTVTAIRLVTLEMSLHSALFVIVIVGLIVIGHASVP
jgi:hypothetical protein